MRVNFNKQRVCRAHYSNNTGTKIIKPNMSCASKPSTSTNSSDSSTIGDDMTLSPSHNRAQFCVMRDNVIKTLGTESGSNIVIINCSNSKKHGEFMMIVDVDGCYQVTRA